MSRKLARERLTPFLINHLTQVKFTDNLSKALQCLLCGNVLRNPMQLSCGHRLCKECCNAPMLKRNDGNKYCPDDGEMVERAFPDTCALVDIMELGCYCTFVEEGCEWIGILLDLEKHTRSCHYSQQEECPFKPFNCIFKGTPTKLLQHLDEVKTGHEGLLLISLQQQVNEVQENSTLLEKIHQSNQLVPVSFTDIAGEVGVLWEEVEECMEEVRNLRISFSTTEQLTNQSSEHRRQLLALFDNYTNIIRSIEQQIQHVERASQEDIANEGVSSPTSKVVEKAQRLQNQGAVQQKQISELGVKIRIAQCSTKNGRYTWKLDKIKARLEEAEKSNVNKELYTPPLYTSDFGYKYSVKVILPRRNRTSPSNNMEFLGIYFVLMKGDYDEILRFPFPYPVEFTLVNATKQSSITHTLYPDPEKMHFAKPAKNMNPAIGFEKFCRISQLKNQGGFVKNDIIYFDIVVKKTGLLVNEPDI